MKDIYALLELKYWNNTLRDYAWALLLFVVIWIGIYLLKKIMLRGLLRLAKRTASPVDDFIAGELSRFGFVFMLTLSVFFASRYLTLPQRLDNALLYLLLIVATFRVVRVIQSTITFVLERQMQVAGEDARATTSSVRTFTWLINGAIWLIAGLFIISNLGINITSFIAGLGVGGIAIALAAQSILGDFFASLTILLDKPFRVGDTITIGDINGTVENIGVKTSRIRSATGEQIVIGNSDLTSTRIRNMQRMHQRRALYRFGIRYDTPADEARAVPSLVSAIVKTHQEVRFDRAHFVAFGDFALLYEIVYFVLNSDLVVFMDVQQQINFEIMDAFAKRGIQFAYPTQTIQLEKEEEAAK